MPERPVDEQLITNFLLGALPESEAERLDELSVTDDDFAERLRAVEDDLVDDYVRGDLSKDALARFNSSYLASTKRREKVTFAKTLADTLDRLPVVHAGQAEAKSRSRWFAVPSLQWGLAAALVILVAGGYLLFENKHLRSQLAQMKAEHGVLEQREQELQRQHSSNTATERELARVRLRLAELEQQLAAGDQGDPEQSEVKLIAFHLEPQRRGISRLPQLNIPAGTDVISFTLEVDPNDYVAYDLLLKDTATGRDVWRSGKLKVIKPVQVKLSASLLKSKNYVLELSGISANGAAEIMSSYPFRVASQ